MHKLQKRVLKLDVYGKEVELNFPTMGQVGKFEKEHKDLDEIDKMYKFLEMSGLNKDMIDEMYPEDVVQVMEMLVPKKK